MTRQNWQEQLPSLCYSISIQQTATYQGSSLPALVSVPFVFSCCGFESERQSIVYNVLKGAESQKSSSDSTYFFVGFSCMSVVSIY